MPNINSWAADTGFGDGTNVTKFEADGTMAMEGDSSAWDDIQNSLIGKSLSSVVGKVDFDWDENRVKMQTGGNIATTADRIAFSIQYPHAAKTDASFNLHVHWEQTDTYTNMPIQLTVKTRLQSNGSAKNTTWTTTVVELNATNSIATYVSGTLNQITKLVDVDMTGASISAIIDVQVARTDSETGEILVSMIDFHYEKSTLGSRTEFTK